ncbi:MobH family relaxase [Hydrocarboniclastica marina]|uniref:HD/PDEase domain-containing protein n=1 Tax=Hydrocarboniclastica marina TaxID=2259620 RepID=A0A4P7XLK0_9ALTE|nr:MobH family relaxase [Hydrocarboniclastica marina]QCF28129.1 hypothetical protein soil367_18835 [Hydrocarboniclastica marina]
MLNKIRNIFGGATAPGQALPRELPSADSCSLSLLRKPKTAVPKEWDTIEVYPPVARSIIAEPIDGILYRNRERILQINEALGLPDDDFDRLLMPVIRNFASFVHLLPASENHHHRGSGGALKHCLEVAFWSARAAEDVIFCLNGDPSTRRKVEPLWRAATCIAGLLHDAGKPIADVEVRDEEGNQWHPLETHLYDWLRKNRINRYYLEWREGRYKRHETFTQRAFDRIVPSEIITHLMAHDRNIVYRISDAYYGLDDGNHIAKIVAWADHESTRRDVAQDVELRTGSDFNYGIPVHRHLFSAARRLISSGKWKVNEPGAKVWHCSEGTFLVWKHALPELIEEVKKEVGVNLRNEPDEIADEMVQRNMAKPKYIDGQEPDSDDELGAYYLYWVITPKVLTEGRDPESVKLTVLKLDTADRLFANEQPAEAEIRIWSTNQDGQVISAQEGLPEGTLTVGSAIVDGSTGEILNASSARAQAEPETTAAEVENASNTASPAAPEAPISNQIKEEFPDTNTAPDSAAEVAEPIQAMPTGDRMSPLDRMLAGGSYTPAPSKVSSKKKNKNKSGKPPSQKPISELPKTSGETSEPEAEVTRPEDVISSLQSIGDDIDFPFGGGDEDISLPEQPCSAGNEEEHGYGESAETLSAGKDNGEQGPAATPTDNAVELTSANEITGSELRPAKIENAPVTVEEVETRAKNVSDCDEASADKALVNPGKQKHSKTVVIGKHRKKSGVSTAKLLHVPTAADPEASYHQFIKDNHAAGRIIEKLVASVIEQGEVLGSRWFIFESRVTIAYPFAFEGGETKPLDALAELEKHGLLYLNPTNPMRKVIEFDGINAIALARRPSSIITAYLVSKEKSIDPHFVAPSPDLRLVRKKKKIDLMPQAEKNEQPEKFGREKPHNTRKEKRPAPDNKTSPLDPEKKSQTESRKEVGIRLSKELVEQMLVGEGGWLIGFKKTDDAISVSDRVVDRIALDEPMASKRLLKQYFWLAADAKGYHWDFSGNLLTLKRRDKEQVE